MARLGRASLLLGLLVVSQLVLLSQAVDRSKFKTCNQAPFCKRGRERANAVTASSAARYKIVDNSVKLNQDDHEITAEIKDTLWPLRDPLTLQIQFIQNDVTRVRINEKAPLHPRFQVRDVLIPEALQKSGAGLLAKDGYIFATFGDRAQYELVVAVEPHPFAVSLKINGNEAVRLNSHGLLNFEQFRDKNPRSIAAPGADATFADPNVHKFPFDEEIDSAWEERFGSHTDSKPRGLADVSMDISFTGSEGLQIYGIPEHASTLALKNTRAGEGGYDEPYRLYNLDVFEYEMDSPMALYGAIPFIMSQSKEHSAAILWLNAAETFIDIREGKEGSVYRKDSYWMSESGIIDVFLFPGPRPSNIFYQYGVLTGFTPIPPTFAVSYHQCRWNYKSEDDVKGVDGGFDENDIPYDVLWLDIEHTDGKKYFTWDRANFPTPRDMQDRLAVKGRKMVTIVDPHIKRDSGYYVHQQSQEKGLYVKNAKAKGGDYEGWCWPGSVSYLDFLRPEVRQYWANQFSLGSYQGSTPNLFIWNDMNEPSVFNGPEVSMPKDCLHGGSEEIEHRDVHNMYGFYNHLSTCQGLTQRGEGDVDGPNRPFVLTRSFFAGSQRYAAMWTGDNKANWEHLKAAQPMLLSLGLAGYSFAGADVGGFFGDPAPELLVRWYQAGAFQPFFRGHAHIDTKRREPWLFGEPYTSLIRDAIRTRYAYLPYVYTTFFNSSIQGFPVMRPLFVEYPTEVATFTIEDQFLLGSDLMIRPVTTPGADTAKVYFPGSEPWFDIRTGRSLPAGGAVHTVKAPIDKIPAYQRGGSIVPKRERARRSSALMVHDPFTLVVALDSKMTAEGKLYLDDGHSFGYRIGAYIYRSFSFAGKTLKSEKGTHPLISTHSSGQYQSKCTVERVLVLGISDKVSKVVAKSAAGTQELTFVQSESRLEIRKPNVVIDEDWSIEIA